MVAPCLTKPHFRRGREFFHLYSSKRDVVSKKSNTIHKIVDTYDMSLLSPSRRRAVGMVIRLVCNAAALLLCLGLIELPSPRPALADNMTVNKAHASWYGAQFHGNPTANGEMFNRHNLTVAHKELPFGVVLRIKNLRNGRQVLVRVNDRGPFIPGRSLDLSQRAAVALNMLHSGTAPVSYEMITDRRGRPLDKDSAFYVHLANAKNSATAQTRAEQLTEKYKRPVHIISTGTGKRTTHALCIGPFNNFRKAQVEFLRCEKESPSLRGIIEGPAKLPDTTAPSLAVKKSSEGNITAAQKVVPLANMPNVGQTAVDVLCSNSLQKSVEVLDTAMEIFFGLHAQPQALSLHYSVLSECPGLSL